ncbi:hypothetical protein GCM10027287_45930 [Bordetella muralis]
MRGDFGTLQQHLGLGIGQAARDSGLNQRDELLLLLREHERNQKKVLSISDEMPVNGKPAAHVGRIKNHGIHGNSLDHSVIWPVFSV